MKNSFFLISISLLVSCSSAKRAQEAERKKELDLIQKMQGFYGMNPDPLFIQIPGGSPQLRFTTPCPDFDSGKVKSKGGLLTVTAPCPPVTFNADSLIRNSALFKMAILEAGKNAVLRQQQANIADEKQKEIESLKQKIAALNKWILLFVCICAPLTLWTFRGPVLKLLKLIP